MDFKALSAALDAKLNQKTFHGVISIYHEGNPVYERASGYADRTHNVHNSMETRFGIASGTKLFTALAIGKLIDDGLLKLRTRLNEILVLPFESYAPDIDIQHLLTHTSGISDYFDEELIKDFDNFKVAVPWSELRGPRDYLEVFPDSEMKFSPGQRFSYSNGGYILLGVIIEEISGKPYREFVSERIFQPARMLHSGYYAFNRLPDNTAYGYIEDDLGWRTNIYNLPIIGASDGGAYTTVGDLRKMWSAFWAGEIISFELVDRFTQPFSKATTEGENRYYGHGIWIYQNDRILEHYITGCDAGVSFESGVILDIDLQLTAISNTTSGVWDILRLMDPFLGKV
jgi:CubicO group peptidase (beta-lactamase class C family)